MFSEQDLENIKSLYMSGLTVKRIALKYGCSQAVMNRYFKGQGIVCRNQCDIAKCGDVPLYFYNYLIRGNKSRRPFDISHEYVSSLFDGQGGKCALTGTQLTFGSSKRQMKDGTASLDRIDSLIGYEVGNVQWVHKHINKLKNDYTEDYLLEQARKVYLYLNYREIILKTIPDKYKVNANIWDKIQHNAAKRYDCNLSKDDIEIVLEQQNFKCVYTGEALTVGRNRDEYYTASLDRIDSKKPYTVDNIQWVHRDINYMKYTYSDSYFRVLIQAVYLYTTKCHYGFLPNKEDVLLLALQKQIEANDCN